VAHRKKNTKSTKLNTNAYGLIALNLLRLELVLAFCAIVLL